LGGNHVDHFFHHADVGVFQGVLQHGVMPVQARSSYLWRATGGGFHKQVVANRLETGIVDKVGCLDIAQNLRFWCSSYCHRNSTVVTYAKSAHFWRQHNGRFKRKALTVDYLPVRVELKRTVSGVGKVAVRHQNLEKPAPVNCHIQWLFGSLQATFGKDFLRTGNAYTST